MCRPPCCDAWRCANPQRYPALLESAVAGPLGKVTILAAQPTAALWSSADGRVHGRGVEPRGANFLDALELWWRHSGRPPRAGV